MDTLNYLLFFWCLYLTFQVHELKSHLKKGDSTPLPFDTPKTSIDEPPSELHQESILSLEPKEPSFLTQLLQKLPKYETTTWIGVFFSIIGTIGAYQYVVEQGWYTPSLTGSYIGLTLFTITGILLAGRQQHPQTAVFLESFTYLFAGAGFFWVSHKFDAYGTTEAILLNLGLLATTLRFRHSDFERFHLWGLFSVSLLLCWYASTTPWLPLIILGRMVHRHYAIALPLFMVLLEAITALSSNVSGSTIAIGAFISLAWGITLYDALYRCHGQFTLSHFIAPMGMAVGFMASLLMNQPLIPWWILGFFLAPHIVLPWITSHSRVVHTMVGLLSGLLYITLSAYWIESQLASIVSSVSGTLLLLHLIGERIRPLLLTGWILAIFVVMFGYIPFHHYESLFLATAGLTVWLLGSPYPSTQTAIAFTPAFPVLLRTQRFSDHWLRACFFSYSTFLLVMDSTVSWITAVLFIGVALMEGRSLLRTYWYYWVTILMAYGYTLEWYSSDIAFITIMALMAGIALRTNNVATLIPFAFITHGYLWSAAPFHFQLEASPLNILYIGMALSMAAILWLRRAAFDVSYALPMSFILASSLYWLFPSVTPWGALATVYALAYLKEYAHVDTVWNKGVLLISAKTLFIDGVTIEPLWHYGECFVVGILLILLARQRRT